MAWKLARTPQIMPTFIRFQALCRADQGWIMFFVH
jgi:hypothetical protein